MIILLSIIIVILLLLIAILISPFKLVIDTTAHSYYLNWKGIGLARLLIEKNELLLRVRMLVFKKDFNLLHSSDEKKTKKKKKTKKVDSKDSNKLSFKKTKSILKTFKVKVFRVNLDTDNFITNGYLIPVFHFLKSPNKSLKINYVGQNNIQLIVENRLYRIIKAYLF